MKLLMIYCTDFSFEPRHKSLESWPEEGKSAVYKDVVVAFIHMEEEDIDKGKPWMKKFLNYLKWAARKNETKNIILHSFAHLSNSKAGAEETKSTLDAAQERLEDSAYIVAQTPFGYFLDLNMQAPGLSQARIFADF